MIIMFIGPSSSGKDFFFSRTLKLFDLEKIILSTTRPKRDVEIEGREYNFIDMATMNILDEEKKLVERRDYNTVNGIWSYATRADYIDLSENYIVINTWQGYEKYLEYYGNNVVYPFYFLLDENLRFERAYERERQQQKKNYLELSRRFIADHADYKEEYLEKYSPIIIDNNGNINDTQTQINHNIKKLIKKV